MTITAQSPLAEMREDLNRVKDKLEASEKENTELKIEMALGDSQMQQEMTDLKIKLATTETKLTIAQVQLEETKSAAGAGAAQISIPQLCSKADTPGAFMDWYIGLVANLKALENMNENLRIWLIYRSMRPYYVNTAMRKPPPPPPAIAYSKELQDRVHDRLPGHTLSPPEVPFKDVNEMLKFVAKEGFKIDLECFQ